MPSLSLGFDFLNLSVTATRRVVDRFADASAQKAGFMSWSRRPPTSLQLNDGGTLATLAQARDLVLDPSQLDQANARWASAGELLMQGATGDARPRSSTWARRSRSLCTPMA